ncbi:MAG: ATP-binding protein [Desulfobacteraceae bacterium]
MGIFDQQNSHTASAPSAEEIHSIEKALSDRPSFSIRFRITLAFLIAFLFSFVIGISSMIYISMMNSKQTFFDNTTKFAFTVEQARRHEKNFFLYHAKTDLFDALANVKSAVSILEGAANEMRSLLNRGTFKELKTNLIKYEGLIQQIIAHPDETRDKANPENPDIESQLRIYGHQILTSSMDLMDQERAKVHKAARTFMLIATFSLVINFLVLTWGTMELARQILHPISRAVEYTERIAAGDFSLIIPQRKIRDEFSTLAIAINRMIFELTDKQKQLIQSRKMVAVGTLTSGIAHELNNPLNNISITAEALLEDLESFSHDELMEMLRDIFTQAERASTTVRNLLDFTRLEQSKVETIDVSTLVQSSLRLVENEHQVKNIESETRIADNLPKVKGNFSKLQQVLINMFINSAQAMPEGGHLCITAGMDDGNFIRIDVSDYGCGIPKENLEKVFDPFFTTKDVGTGTGLGLSVSYGIIKEIGGRITVDSSEGAGTTFSVFLPISKKSE